MRHPNVPESLDSWSILHRMFRFDRRRFDALDARWPGMRDRLCDSTPQVRRHINVFVDGVRRKLDGAIPPGAQVHVLTAISGG